MKRTIRFRRKILPRMKPPTPLFELDIDEMLLDLDPGFAAPKVQS